MIINSSSSLAIGTTPLPVRATETGDIRRETIAAATREMLGKTPGMASLLQDQLPLTEHQEDISPSGKRGDMLETQTTEGNTANRVSTTVEGSMTDQTRQTNITNNILIVIISIVSNSIISSSSIMITTVIIIIINNNNNSSSKSNTNIVIRVIIFATKTSAMQEQPTPKATTGTDTVANHPSFYKDSD